MQEQLAMNWYHVERRECEKLQDARIPRELRDPPPSWLDLTDARRDEIRARVNLVLTGEIRRSEMGPGDLAVYFGRHRFLEQQPPAYFMERLKKQTEYNEQKYWMDSIQRKVWWDCLEFFQFSYPCRSTMLFGSNNIGNWNLTNLQVGGMFPANHLVYLCGWHLSVGNEPELVHNIERLFTNGSVNLIVGDYPCAERRLINLYREPQPLAVSIPDRQNFSVWVEFYGKELRRFHEKICAMGERDGERHTFRLWIHLEGWQLRLSR